MNIMEKRKINDGIIEDIAAREGIDERAKAKLLKMNAEAYDALGKASAYGRLMQEMLLEYMPAAALKTEINKRLLHINSKLSEQ